MTLKHVAAEAGVSFQTVSKALNGSVRLPLVTQARIERAAEDLGYRPNHRGRSLRAQRSWALGYSWAPAPPDLANPILDQFLQSMLRAAEECGYHLLAFPHLPLPEDHQSSYRELIRTGRVDGFVLSNVEYGDPRVRLLLSEGFPFVAFGRSDPGWEFPWVDVDGGEGVRLATNHLLELGHRRIAALAWPATSRVGSDRLNGYFQAMETAGISPSPEWIARGQGHFDFGRAAARAWLAQPVDRRPTAIVGLNDAMAIGAMHAAREAGLEPGMDLALTGFDDAPMVQYLSPPLTSLRQPIEAIGSRVVTMLVDFIEGRTPPASQVLLPPRLIERASSLTPAPP
ncbi:MAG: LacI family DNA-binding transcriptional regulator [Anaerolineales bacterium]